MKPTETLARFITETGFEDLPGDAVEKSKWAIIDGVAVTFGGWQVIGPQVVAFVKSMGGNPESTIVGSGGKTNPPLAAFANATMSHVLDYDDINESMGGHPTGPVLGAVLALGEKLGASGRECLVAYLIGVETETKIGRALITTLYRSGWHPTSVLGVMGSAAACGKLLGLNHEQMVMALGMAGSFAGGLKQNFGTLTKSLHVGQAAKNGVMAALLARDGWTAAPDVIEGDVGYSNLFCARDEFDLSQMTDHLGEPWDIIDPGIKLKKYPCCGSIHPALDAMLRLLDKTNLTVNEVEELICSVHPSKQHILVNPRPRTGLAAKFSVEYCIARALADGRISIAHFQDANVRDDLVTEFLPRVTVLQDPELPEWASRITVKTKDGRILNEICNNLPGIESDQDLASKFNDCVAPVIGADRARSVFETIRNFENLTNIAEFMGLLIKEST